MSTVVVLTIGDKGRSLRDCQFYRAKHTGEEFTLRRFNIKLEELLVEANADDTTQSLRRLDEKVETFLRRSLPEHDTVVFQIHDDRIFDQPLSKDELDELFCSLGWRRL
jgi:hypothetical protein